MVQIKKWEILSVKDISPSRWFPLFLHQVKLPEGKIVDYYVSKLGDVSMLIPITRDKKIVFCRQYKHGAQQVLTELPCGRIEKRTLEDAAKIELLEETGIVANKLIYCGVHTVAPSKDGAMVYGYIVPEAQITEKTHFEETENIETVQIPIAELDEKIASGEIMAVETISMLTLAKIKFPEYFKI